MEVRKDLRKEVLKVRVRRDLTVDNEIVNVRRTNKDEIEWHTEEVPIRISFDPDASPFEKSIFDVVPGQPVRSGPAVGGVGDYNYYINSEALAMSADPGVSVRE